MSHIQYIQDLQKTGKYVGNVRFWTTYELREYCPEYTFDKAITVIKTDYFFL